MRDAGQKPTQKPPENHNRARVALPQDRACTNLLEPNFCTMRAFTCASPHTAAWD